MTCLHGELPSGNAPSPGAVYPLLTMLEEEDLIASTPEGAKKLYTLTSHGEAWLKDNDALVQGIMTRIAMAASHYSSHTAPDSVWEAWKTLKQAMNMARSPWTEQEAERIRADLLAAQKRVEEEQRAKAWTGTKVHIMFYPGSGGDVSRLPSSVASPMPFRCGQAYLSVASAKILKSQKFCASTLPIQHR